MSSGEHNVYVDELFSSYCAADVLQYFQNYKTARERDKEISESMACFHAAIDYLAIDRKNPDTLVYVIGDGKYPRTGSIYAFFTSWLVFSIDPQLDMGWQDAYNTYRDTIGKPIQRLILRPTTFEEMSMVYRGAIRKDYAEYKIIVVLPHSHVRFEDVIKKMGSFGHQELEYAVISLPCCVAIPPQLMNKKALDLTGLIRYTDTNVMSHKREVIIHKKMSQKLYEKLLRKKL